MSFLNFAQRMNVIAEQVGSAGVNLAKQIGSSVVEEVIPATPIKTGRARANWQAQSNADPTSEVPTPSSPGTATQDAIAAAKSAINAHNGGDLYIANNLPYIGKLNDGSSAQAPQNFVQAAVQRAVSKYAGKAIIK